MIIEETYDCWDTVEHHTYKIEKGDILDSVAQKLGKNRDCLRTYHNMHCIPDADVIPDDFPSHLEYLLLKPEKLQANGEPEKAPPEPVRFSSDAYQLPFKPARLKNNYLGMYTIENGDKKTTIKEEILVKWVTINDNGYSFFEINKLSKVYIDGYETDLIADQLAEKMAYAFYPLTVIVNEKGKWVDIHNYDTIKERWENTKTEILKEYQGEVIEEWLDIYDLQIANKSAIIKALSSDWFLRAFFNGINTQYNKELVFENEVYFPISTKTSDVKFKVEQRIDPDLDSYNLINITQKGILADTRTREDFEGDTDFPYDTLSNEEPENAEGTYTATYFLNPNNYCVESLFLECTIALTVPQKVTVQISNLDDNEEIRTQSTVSFFAGEVEKEESLFKGVLRLLRG
ncbi:peptidoglycan-binding protein LysM [Flavobacterium sp. ZT3R18]|uniref:peptidoglycan-binding protein LysM n=1 Tax=Flavobacterium sp. ZT3R18 TaxID=2594429 RepID=UPI00117B62AF|nr:peptidoglycan-binding protein LysM [Flavobacterium sp. ZT3R18]TRX37434.1 peptidoglycan-binding protein LysM [Flavobacterium sp. ZT3R18]